MKSHPFFGSKPPKRRLNGKLPNRKQATKGARTMMKKIRRPRG